MRPILVSCYFGENPEYARLARVLRFTIDRHCPGWDVRLEAIAPADLPKHPTATWGHLVNTQKMEHWYQAVAAAPDGARMLLLDADTAILRSIDDVWDDPTWEFGYTTKDHRFPFNSGVVFLRVTPSVRAFMRIWRDENRRMLTAEAHHQDWRGRYGGINQAALGYALDSGLARALAIRQLPCAEWNCEDSGWRTFDPAVTRILHIKSALRREIFRGFLGPIHVTRHAARVWRALEAEMLGQAVTG